MKIGLEPLQGLGRDLVRCQRVHCLQEIRVLGSREDEDYIICLVLPCHWKWMTRAAHYSRGLGTDIFLEAITMYTLTMREIGVKMYVKVYKL